MPLLSLDFNGRQWEGVTEITRDEGKREGVDGIEWTRNTQVPSTLQVGGVGCVEIETVAFGQRTNTKVAPKRGWERLGSAGAPITQIPPNTAVLRSTLKKEDTAKVLRSPSPPTPADDDQERNHSTPEPKTRAEWRHYHGNANDIREGLHSSWSPIIPLLEQWKGGRELGR
ncbi:hypothetical protein B0H16DRAFT_1692668 [Mycena metata]|uniref:Uncharacterized protein n=1 Tax=Mycena metata TaxID=1033252 RepID=A0AAD7IMK1_9AGAR|nr:hypothetical protein B0H16DRAFT_1692668 [Mycena metata]